MNDTSSQPQVEQHVAGVRAGPRILQVLPALGQGGVERGTLDIARHLVSQGWTALVASSGGPTISQLAACGGMHFKLPLATKNPWVIRANIARLQKLISDHDVQLVHARSRAPAWSAYFAARRREVPFVTTFHGVYEGSEHWLKRHYNAVMAKGDRVIAISEYVADHVRSRYGVGPDRLRVIPRGVDVNAFDPAAITDERTAPFKERWRVEPGSTVVMLPGRVTRIKGHQLLLRAIDRMARRNFVCLLVGGLEPRSGYTAELEGLIGAMGLGGNVRMVGACDDMPAALALADIVVVPSIGPEAFGRVSVEAQAMGRPVIVTDIGGLSETVMPAVTGWVVPPGDVDELANALDLALAMPADARARLAERARRHVVHAFSAREMGRRTLAVYRELIEGAPPEPEAAAEPPALGVPVA